MIFILGNLWIIVFSIKSRPITALFGLGTIVLGIIVYLFFARNHANQEEDSEQKRCQEVLKCDL
jgi:APA family basic amino acid/polyamine antiporter